MPTEEGIVTQLSSGATAWVKTTPSGACKACSSRDACMSRGHEKEVEALNPAGARVGDRIVLSIESGPLLKASFLLYVFPILCLLAGALVGQSAGRSLGIDNPSSASALVGFLLFFMAVGFVKAKGNQMSQKSAYQPKIIKILKHQSFGEGIAAPTENGRETA